MNAIALKRSSIRAVMAVAVIVLASLASNVTAADSPDEAVEKQARETYRAEKKDCDKLKGNAEDVCEAQAKAKRDIAIANARAKTKNTAEARADAAEVKAKAEYDIAEEKCDNLQGKEQDACESQAKAIRDKALAAAQQMRK